MGPHSRPYISTTMLNHKWGRASAEGDTGMGEGYVRTWEHFPGAATGACFWYGRETLI